MKDPLRELPGYALRRASAVQIAGFAQLLKPLGLTFAEASVLMVIAANPGTTLSALGRVLDIKRANMTPLVARLEARGMLDRVPTDGRSHGLSLSRSGTSLRAEVAAVVSVHEDTLMARVPAASRDHVMPILHALWTG